MVVFLNVLLSIMTFGMFTLAEVSHDILTINDPIAELNGLTLKELFEDSNVVDAIDFPIINDGADYYTPFDEQLLGYDFNKKYYSIINVDIINNTTNVLQLFNRSNGVAYEIIQKIGVESGNNQIFTYIKEKHINEINNGTYDIRFIIGFYAEYQINYIKMYSLEDLGIDDLSKEQMDYYYSIYQMGRYHDVSYTINEVDLTDIVIIVSSAFIWLFFIRFIKEVL